MKKVNLHTHSNYCDGSSHLIEYVEKAIEMNFSGIGFSSHAPLGFESSWHMKSEDYEKYEREKSELKIEYKDRIEVWMGLEVDFFDDQSIEFNTKDTRLDYIIGAVHFLGKGSRQCIDESSVKLEETLRNEYQNDISALIKDYYSKVAKMVQNGNVDIVAHFDLIKKFNSDNEFFDEAQDWYREIVFEAIANVKADNPIFEVNSRGYYRGNTIDFYPSDWIIKYLISEKFRITINSDAHEPTELDLEYDKIKNRLRALGLDEIVIFEDAKWQSQSLSLTA